MTERPKSLGPTYAKPKQVSKLSREGISNPSEVLRDDAILLISSLGREEIHRARIKAREITRETGKTPELVGAHIAEVVRKAVAANKLGGMKKATEVVSEAREALYAQMAELATLERSPLPTLSNAEESRLTVRSKTAFFREKCTAVGRYCRIWVSWSRNSQ
ncbi:hypothetical protein BVY00_00905 [bacterium G20]|nr:hypothetical protein BVY00_00905 [bacterium G20]